MKLDLFPLNVVLFPGSSMPLHIFEPRYLEMIEQCLSEDLPIGIILLLQGRPEDSGGVDIHSVGTVADIVNADRSREGVIDIHIAGRRRFLVDRVIRRLPRLIADVNILEWETRSDESLTEPVEELRRVFGDYWRTLLSATGQWSRQMWLPDTGLALAEFVAAGLQIGNHRRQLLLEQRSLADLIRLEITIVGEELPGLQRVRAAREQRHAN